MNTVNPLKSGTCGCCLIFYAMMAQNRDDYNAAYGTAVSRYEATKAEREKAAADIRQRGICRREFERFVTELEKRPEAVSKFGEAFWGSLGEYVTVGKDKTMVFTLMGGTEMKARTTFERLFGGASLVPTSTFKE